MDAFDADPLVAELTADPEPEEALAGVLRLGESSPAEGAALLERLGASTAATDPARAGKLFTEAAALWSGAAGNPKLAAKALRTAIELAPGDDEALARLTALYTENGKHRALARILERRAEVLTERAGGDRAARARAAEAFTGLGNLLRDPPVDSPVEAIAAYNRAIAGGVAPVEALRGARALYLRAGQLTDALPLFALERERVGEADKLAALHREEAAVRALAGDATGATDALRRAHAFAPGEAGIARELGRSILARLDAGEPLPADDCSEAAEVFAGAAELSGSEDEWRAAQRCFTAAARWEDASWAAERRGAYPEALELLGRAVAPSPEDRVRLGVRTARLLAVGMGDVKGAAARYAALLDELPPGCDAPALERLIDADRGGAGSSAEVAARLEAAALKAQDLRALKLAFALSARALAGGARAAELVRQAEVLVGLGAERSLALRHGEAGLEGVDAAAAGPLLERLAALGGPDELFDLHERHVARQASSAERAAAIEVAVRVGLERASVERLGVFFEAIAARGADDRALGALEKAAAEGDARSGGTALRVALAVALARAAPVLRDGGRARSALLRRAARIARRDLGDPDLAFEWLGEALFARLDAALDEALAPLQGHAADLHRVEGLVREVRGLLEPEPGRLRGGDPAPRSPGTQPPPDPGSARPAPPVKPMFGAPPSSGRPTPPGVPIAAEGAPARPAMPPGMIPGGQPLSVPPGAPPLSVPPGMMPGGQPLSVPPGMMPGGQPLSVPPGMVPAAQPLSVPPGAQPLSVPPGMVQGAQPASSPPAPPAGALVPPVPAAAPAVAQPAALPPQARPPTPPTRPPPPLPTRPPPPPLPPRTHATPLPPGTMRPPPPPLPPGAARSVTAVPPAVQTFAPPGAATHDTPPPSSAVLAPGRFPPMPPVPRATPAPTRPPPPYPPAGAEPGSVRPPPSAPVEPPSGAFPAPSEPPRASARLPPQAPAYVPPAYVPPAFVPPASSTLLLEAHEPTPMSALYRLPAGLAAQYAADLAVAPGPAARQSRVSGEALIADLFEAMHALNFCKDALEGAGFTLRVAMEKLASSAGLVHLYDIDRREFVVVRAGGPGATALRGLRVSEAEPLVAEALCTSGALILPEAAGDGRASGLRWEILRATIEPPLSLVAIACARMARAGRYLGLIELANLSDAGPFAEGDEHALAYIAQTFTEFVVEHGVLLDDD